MTLNQKVIWAEIKHKILESAVMISDGYTDDDVIAKLMEVVDLLENTEPRGGKECSRCNSTNS